MKAAMRMILMSISRPHGGLFTEDIVMEMCLCTGNVHPLFWSVDSITIVPFGHLIYLLQHILVLEPENPRATQQRPL